MANTAKISITVPIKDLEWAKASAKKRNAPLSLVISEALAEQKRKEAMDELLAWLKEGNRPVSPEELEAARRELWG
jgi:hypothetical protein